MTESDAIDPAPATFADLPLQPTGSGVADLEIAYEQMRLAEGDTTLDRTEDTAIEPLGVDRVAGNESAAHPS